MKRFLVILMLIIMAMLLFSCEKLSESDTSSYSSDSYEMDHATYCILYIDVSNVKVEHSGNYTYIAGSVTNTGTYSIKYVKVSAACKDYKGNIIDTDWTYAVDSNWLNPGESKKFEMMVKDPDNDIRTATVSVIYE